MRWLCVLLLLVVLLACLEASQRPRRVRFSRLGRKAQTVAGAVRRHQHKKHRRGEVADSRVSMVRRAGQPRAKTRSAQGNSRPKTKSTKKDYITKAARQARGKKQRNAAARRRLSNGKEICLYRALRRCGRRVVKILSSAADFEKRCRTKEKFLDCMSMMQQKGCKVKRRRRRRGPARRLVKQYQRKLQRLLIGARGCVIGVDLSATTPYR